MKRRALFVGVNYYKDDEIRNLSCSLSDAYSLRALFESLGYQTGILENPSKNDVLNSVVEMTADLKPGDFFLFYFSGHGWTTEGGRHLLFCTDDMYRQLRFGFAGLPFDLLKANTEEGGFSRAFVLDACRSDFFTGQKGADTTTKDLRPIGELVRNASARSSLAVFRSCSQYEHAIEIKKRRHGLFTLAMMDVLRQSQESGMELVFGETLCDAVTARMTMIAREDGITDVQTPEFAKSGVAPVLINGRKAAAEPQNSNLVVCPVCGDYNLITDTFRCRVCGREHLCKRHRDDAENCCADCAAERVRKREEEKRQKEAAERARQEERKHREEPERKRLEEAFAQEVPFVTLDLSGVPLKMIKVKAGLFQMGSPGNEVGRHDDEKLHRVTLTKDFWLGETQVTQGQWKAVMGNNPSSFQKGDDYPVEQVSWDDAMEFCDQLNRKYGGRLPSGYRFSPPTEAQWEYACRAGTTTALNSGKNLTGLIGLWGYQNEVGWYEKNSGGSTHPVAQKRPNAWGFYDMHGNVWEWCRDWYDKDYGCNMIASCDHIASVVFIKDATDPQGPSSGSHRVVRGGSWRRNAYCCRAACRGYLTPSIRGLSLGFRLALVPVQNGQ